MQERFQIYVDSEEGNDHPETSGDQRHPVRTADRAFSLLPDHWTGQAEIIFVPRSAPYDISTDSIYLGTPVGSEASSLVIRADGYPYNRVREITATGGDAHRITFDGSVAAESFIGNVVSRLNAAGEVTGPAVSIRGNTGGAIGPTGTTIDLQRSFATPVRAGERFAIEAPRVTLRPLQTLHLTSHDARSPNLTMIGIEIAPVPGAGLNFLNVRAFCDTCAFHLQTLVPPPGGLVAPVIFNIHSNSRIHGGIEEHPTRGQAGVLIHSNHPANIVRAVRGGVFGGHLTFNNVTVQVSQGGWLVPRTLEARAAPIQILTGGSALAEPSRELGVSYSGWGTPENKARIRNVSNGDGLRIFNGGSVNSPLGPICLDVYGCSRDGVRLDSGGWGFFGPRSLNPPSEIDTALTSSGPKNAVFGMHVCNAARAVVGRDTTLEGRAGQVALDGVVIDRGWLSVREAGAHSNAGLSLVRLST
jgi:hypothetical protein